MRKLLLSFLALAAVISASTAALASSEYDTANNKITVDGTGYNTAIVAKNTGQAMTAADVVYIGESKDGFGTAAEFLFKENPAYGFYTIMLGSSDGTTKSAKFFIGETTLFTSSITKSLESLDGYEVNNGDGTYKKAYVAKDVDLAAAKSVVIEYGGKTMCQDISTSFGGGTANIAIELTDVPEEYVNDVTVSISSYEIVDDDLIIE